MRGRAWPARWPIGSTRRMLPARLIYPARSCHPGPLQTWQKGPGGPRGRREDKRRSQKTEPGAAVEPQGSAWEERLPRDGGRDREYNLKFSESRLYEAVERCDLEGGDPEGGPSQ
ncbi:hypothetical protein NDU88_003000 [Pleurodeles waltl]|uniref:Uncharacterized protein n=1 Tax=Pleurodeles waltl TaxID=8319 RepID=A0AAV7SEK4_PLEWA|nr:hypothetical protein NDU88_003000 [Pleurodeles waltl]